MKRAQEFLSRAWLIDRQIDNRLEQIRKLRVIAKGVGGTGGQEPVKRTRDVTGMQNAVVRIMEEEELINRQIDELVEVRREIEEVIRTLRRADWKLVLEKRYLGFCSWAEVAWKLDRSVRWAQMRHKEALEEVERVLEERDGG